MNITENFYLIVDKRYYSFNDRFSMVDWLLRMGYNKKKIIILNTYNRMVEFDGIAQIFIKYFNDIYETTVKEFKEFYETKNKNNI